MLEARITHIESRMGVFEVIDLNTMEGTKVAFGATVELENIETEEKKTYTILGPDEADFEKGSISILSPIAKTILRKKTRNEAIVDAPGEKIKYKILSVQFLGEQAD